MKGIGECGHWPLEAIYTRRVNVMPTFVVLGYQWSANYSNVRPSTINYPILQLPLLLPH